MQTQIVMVLFAPYANVAQSVEQLIRNQQVAGSIPAVSSIEKIEQAEKLKNKIRQATC